MATHTTTAHTVTGTTTAGNAIVVGFACDDDGSPGTTATCADSKGNTYSSVNTVQASATGSGAGVRSVLFVALNTTALVASTDVITVTHGAVAASAVVAEEVAGLQASGTALDKSNSNVESSTSTPTSNTSGALTQANEVAFGVIGVEDNDTPLGGTVRDLPDLVEANSTGGGPSSNIGVVLQGLVVNATTALTAGYTVSGAGNNDTTSLIGTYNAVTGGTSVGDPKLMLNGTEYSKTLTTANAMYTEHITSASYPSNAAGIGMRSSGTTADTFFYEGGVLVAYTPAVSPIPMPLGRRSQYTVRV